MSHDRDQLLADLVATDAEIGRMQDLINVATRHRMSLARRIELSDEIDALDAG